MNFNARTLAARRTTQPASKRVKLNSIWLLLARLIMQAQLILFTVLVARSLGVVGFGQYAIVAALIVLGNIATTFGTDTLLIREVAHHRKARTRQTADGLITSALWIQLTLSLAWLIVVGISADASSGQSPEVVSALKIYSLSLVPLAFFAVFTAVLRAYERMDVYLVLNIIVAFLQLGGAWLVLQENGDLLSLVMMLDIMQVLAAVSAGAMCYLAVPAFRFDWAITRRQLLQVARLAWPFALLSLLAVIYQRLGVLMLATLSSEAQAGWFAAATRVIEPVKMLHFAVLGALFPALSHLTVREDQIATYLYRRSMLLLLMFSAVAALILIVLAQPIVTLLFGASYADSASLIQILALSLIPYTFSASLSMKLVTRGKEQRVLWVTAVSLIVAFLSNRWLIPSAGSNGAALAVLLSESVMASILFVLRR